LTSRLDLLIIKDVMRIGLLADTHIPDVANELPPEITGIFLGVDLILHAGDIYAQSVLDDLENIAPVLAARGDDDYLSELRDERVREKHVLQIEGHTLWLVHERAYYFQSAWAQSRVPIGQEKYDFPDIVVFGHEHRTVERCIDNILFMSPGSPTFLEYRYGLGTVGILDIGSDRVDVQIIQL
jgi:putative phosphoesterase